MYFIYISLYSKFNIILRITAEIRTATIFNIKLLYDFGNGAICLFHHLLSDLIESLHPTMKIVQWGNCIVNSPQTVCRSQAML